MAVSVGKIEPFDPSNVKEWTHYIEQCSTILLYGIQEADKKRAVLISVMVPQAYKLFKKSYRPEYAEQKDFSATCQGFTGP